MTTEKLFSNIETPLYKGGDDDGVYHVIVSRSKTGKFAGNFLSGTRDFYYKRNFTAKTLNELLQKMYNKKPKGK